MASLASAGAVVASIEDLDLLLVSDPKRKNAIHRKQFSQQGQPATNQWSHP